MRFGYCLIVSSQLLILAMYSAFCRQERLAKLVKQEHERAEPISCSLDDFLDGTWTYSDGYRQPPGYEWCAIDQRQDCRANNRSYLDWAWTPRRPGCRPRPLERRAFLEWFRNKSIAFVGDSMARNQQQSLQCVLMTEPETGLTWSEGYKLAYDSYYPEFDVRVQQLLSGWRDFIRPENVHELSGFDYVIISVGSAWRRADSGLPNVDDLHADHAREMIRNAVNARWKALQGLPAGVQVIWKTPDLPHWAGKISDQPWSLPCSRQPAHRDMLQMWIREALLHERRRDPGSPNLHVMDVLKLIEQRADAHPNEHSLKFGAHFDCLHWCLPGVPDTINEIIFNFIQTHAGAGR